MIASNPIFQESGDPYCYMQKEGQEVGGASVATLCNVTRISIEHTKEVLSHHQRSFLGYLMGFREKIAGKKALKLLNEHWHLACLHEV